MGITETWRSQWVTDKKHFGEYLVEDQRIRLYIKKEYSFAGIPRIEIQRTRDNVHVTIFAARPGLVIGRRGVEVERLKSNLGDLTGHDVDISIEEVHEPQLDAQLISEDVAQQLERRTSFRRAIRRSAEMTMAAGADGIKILVAGRLGGSEMARREKIILGGLPLATLRSKIDYGFSEAATKYGNIGVKVWVNHGMMAPGERIGDQEEQQNAPNA